MKSTTHEIRPVPARDQIVIVNDNLIVEIWPVQTDVWVWYRPHKTWQIVMVKDRFPLSGAEVIEESLNSKGDLSNKGARGIVAWLLAGRPESSTGVYHETSTGIVYPINDHMVVVIDPLDKSVTVWNKPQYKAWRTVTVKPSKRSERVVQAEGSGNGPVDVDRLDASGLIDRLFITRTLEV